MDFSKIKTWTINGKEVKTLEVDGQVYWKKEEVPTINYFYVEDCSGSDNSLSLEQGFIAPDVTLEYSTDGKQWQEWVDLYNSPLPISPNGRVYLRGTNNTFGKTSYGNTIKTTKNFNVGGDVTTLLVPEGGLTDLSGRNYCFYNLFFKSTFLQNAKDLILPSTTLVETCYAYMFGYCSSLVSAPKVLPATTLARYCYANMFESCSSLVNAPELPATTLYENCYDSMFQGCTKLNSIKVGATTWVENNTVNWVNGVASSGTFTKPKGLTNIPTGTNGIPSGWTVEDVDFTNYFYVEDVSGSDNSLTLTKDNSNAPDIKLEYSTDKQVWNSWAEPYTTPLPIKANSKVFLRGTNNSFTLDYNANKFNCSGKFNVGGDLTTLLDPNGNVLDLTGRDSVFSALFYNTKVVDASKLILPSTTLPRSCYNQMFYGCTSLVTAPKVLPATTLADYCYNGMFSGCTSLVNAPELPATTIADNCYQSMFKSCTSLVNAPELPATTLASQCYRFMFERCTSLVTAPKILPATTIAVQCYESMFSGCTSLVTAPVLPATYLNSYCYKKMFEKCTKLNYIKVGALSWDQNYANSWLYKVAPIGTFEKPKELTNIPTNSSGIPSGWTVVEV